ncbi:LOW QUALITY PROTEIN: nicotinamidase-like [Panonychus citri]|uniref:LOW QUALITY PROTEIN: nicotinamidase-like n=1 Tax=Panonychus citri TaxID=50023 RepID=UPI0023080751|nr:LOW QUALITY PROTEIN: nicotinamidase-like [Panonychus citri]
MSSNVNCNSNFDDCDLMFNEFASAFGSLDLEGFTRMINQLFNGSNQQLHSSSCSPDQLIQVFNTFDCDGDGCINRDEFKSMWSKWLSIVIKPKSALIVVDVQNDFISGSLGLENFPSGVNCSSIVPIINSLIDQCSFEIVVYTLDWHPEDHISFIDNVHLRKVKQLNGNQVDGNCEEKSLIVNPFDCLTFHIDHVGERNQILPKHCVQSTWGSQLHDQLKVIKGAIKVYKGTNPIVDSYSGFKDNEAITWTQLDEQLRSNGITDVYICGLAYDICVYHTAKDSLSLNYRTIIIDDCCKGTDDKKIDSIRKQLTSNGCLIVQSNQIEPIVSGTIKPWPLAYHLFFNIIKTK